MKYDVIIIGAGAAGLMAMKELLDSGLKVCLLEAAPHAGGRISTLRGEFAEPVELGAEFVHGKLPLTLGLLEKAKIPYVPVEGRMIPVHKGEWFKEDAPDENWDALMSALKKQQTDMSIRDFLVENFSDPKYIELRNSVQGFAEGFNLADLNTASVISIRNEWKHVNDEQYRVAGGYNRLIDYLVNCCWLPDAIIHYNSFVHTINYEHGNVTVFTKDGQEYKGSKLIVTCSLGMLRSNEIRFDPPLIVQNTAINELGFGSVIKFLFEFEEPFWKNYNDNIGFLLSDQSIPTWWTQLPAETNLLTGWIGGPPAYERRGDSEISLKDIALESLGAIFNMPPFDIENKLRNWRIIDWHNHPLAKGGYSFTTLKSGKAKQILSEPVYETIWFAGEAFSSGESQGTVEAALFSGVEVARKIIMSRQ